MAIIEDKLIVLQPRKERPRKRKRADSKSHSGRAGCRHRAPNTGPAPFTSSRCVGGVGAHRWEEVSPHFTGTLFTGIVLEVGSQNRV